MQIETLGPGPMSAAPALHDEVRHATTVSVAGRGLMIVGPSGSGKSALALMLMAFGGQLVADDRTRLWLSADATEVWADAPADLPALVEARGVGLLPVRLAGPVPLVAVADMGRHEPARLPEPHWTDIFGRKVALFHGAENEHFAYAILQYLGTGAALDQIP